MSGRWRYKLKWRQPEMTRYKHTLEMNTTQQGFPASIVEVQFEQSDDLEDLLFYEIHATKPLSPEDLTSLEEWVKQDKQHWQKATN